MVKAIANGIEEIKDFFICSAAGPAVFVLSVMGLFGFVLPAIVNIFA